MKKEQKIILIKSIFVLFILTLSCKAFAIWAPPYSNPVNDNPFPPLNISTAPQQKIGNFIIGNEDHSFNSFYVNGSVELIGNLQIKPTPTDTTKTYILTPGQYMNVVWEEVLSGNQSTESIEWKVLNNIVSLKHVGDDVRIGSYSSIYKRPNFNNPDINQLFIHTTGVNGGEQEDEDVGLFYNIFLGREAGYFDVTGETFGVYGNTGVGYQSLYSLSDDDAADEIEFFGDELADHNTALGFQALYNNTEGSENTALGREALKGGSSITGQANTAVGYGVLSNLTTGNNNTAVGGKINSSDQATGIATSGLENTTAIGHNVIVSNSNTMVFGNQSLITTWAFAGASVDPATELIKVGTNSSNGSGARLLKTGQWSGPSDRNKKHDMVNISYGLDEVMKLRPVNFKWNGTNKEDIGLIAQEVKEIIPEIVSGREGDMAISYSQLNVVLIKAIQEQKKEIEGYRKEFEDLKIRLEALKKNN